MGGEMTKYIITKKECQKQIKGVCEGCGVNLEPIETVNNSNEPTFWVGCKSCMCFRVGVDKKYFEIARKLVEKGDLLPYSHMSRCEYEDKPERLKYYLDSQTAGLSHRIAQIDKMLTPKEKEGCR